MIRCYLNNRNPLVQKFGASLRFYRVTNYGELVSKPKPIKSKVLYHPVLGEYQSEELVNDDLKMKDRLDKDALTEHPHIKLSAKRQLDHALSESHLGSKEVLAANGKKMNIVPRIKLGSVVFLQQKPYLTSKKMNSIFGLVIDQDLKKGISSFIRVRSVIAGIGVEYKIPIYSPLVENVKIVQEPKFKIVTPTEINGQIQAAPLDLPSDAIFASNLFGVRDSIERMSRWMNKEWLNDKGRVEIVRKLERSIDSDDVDITDDTDKETKLRQIDEIKL